MSTPALPDTPVDTWIAGLPITTLPLIRVFVAAAPTMMPFVLPMAVFSSTRLLLPLRMPMPKSSLGVTKPFPVVSFHRSELSLPRIHMPPQDAPGCELPFRTETFDPMLILDDVGLIRMPDWQLVVVVTPSTLPSSVPVKKMPCARNRWTTPGPRTSTSL